MLVDLAPSVSTRKLPLFEKIRIIRTVSPPLFFFLGINKSYKLTSHGQTRPTPPCLQLHTYSHYSHIKVSLILDKEDKEKEKRQEIRLTCR